MRAESDMFKEGLLTVDTPANVAIRLVFASEGDVVWDYSEGDLKELAPKLVEYYKRETKVEGGAQLKNFWKALIGSAQHFAFQDEMRALADKGKLDEAALRAGLLKHYPRLPGDHMGVLRADGLLGELERCR
jgi:hypothetical protein